MDIYFEKLSKRLSSVIATHQDKPAYQEYRSDHGAPAQGNLRCIETAQDNIHDIKETPQG